MLFIAFLNYILNYVHSAHTRVPRSALHDFHPTPIIRVVKKFQKIKKM